MSHINHRKTIKSKKPTFVAQDSHKLKRIKGRWRKPKGLQSKMRLGKMGYNVTISSGWRSPNTVRGQSPQGLFPVMVHRVTDLAVIDKKTQAVVVASSVSSKNKIIIFDKAKEHGILVLNRKADKLPVKIEEAKKIKEQSRKDREAKKSASQKAEKKSKSSKKEKKEAVEEERIEEELEETKELVKTPKKDTLNDEKVVQAEKMHVKEKADHHNVVSETTPKSDGKQNK